MSTIVFVDDSSKWTANYKRMLTPFQDELHCVYFHQPEEAMEYMSSHPTEVLVSELDMPVMSGRELFEMVDMLSPDTVKIGMTQVRDVTDTLDMLNQIKIYKLILKPFFVAEDLIVPIRAALEHYAGNEREREIQQRVEQKLQMLNKETEELQKKMNKKKRGHDRILKAMLGMMEQNLRLPVAEFDAERKDLVKDYCEELLREFFQYYMYEKKNLIFYLSYLKNKFHLPGRACNFMIRNHVEEEIPVTVMNRIAYAMFLRGFLCQNCLNSYFIENVLEEEGKEYVLSVRYFWTENNYKGIDPKMIKLLQRMVKELEQAVSDRMEDDKDEPQEQGQTLRLYFRKEEQL